MENVQLVLIGSNSSSTDLTVFLSKSEQELLVFLGVALLERVSNDPNAFAYKMLVGRLANAGTSVTHLARTFGHDVRTIRKWAEALLCDDPELVVRAFAGRGPLPKVCEPLVRFVKGRYLRLRNVVRDYRKQIADEVRECFRVELSRETLRRLFVLAREDVLNASELMTEQYADSASAARHEAVPSDADERDRQSAEKAEMEQTAQHAATDEPGPVDQLGGQPEEHEHRRDDSNNVVAAPGACTPDAPPRTEVANGCHLSPKLIGSCNDADNHSPLSRGEDSVPGTPCSPFMPLRQGKEAGPTSSIPGSGKEAPTTTRIIHHAGQILFSVYMDAFTALRAHARGVQTQWIGQVLQGAVNIEQSRLICAPSLELFTGPVTSSPDDQRTALGEIATVENVIDAYAANARLLSDGPGCGTIFYYDPHSKECTTNLWKFLKAWCGGRHRISKLLHMDFIHTESGFPCFLQHYDNFYDMRERFFITLELFRLLFPRHSVAGSTFIIDRGIFARDMFDRFRLYGCDLLTWEKGYERDGWAPDKVAVEFKAYRTRNSDGDLREYTFQCQESCWEKDPSVRRIIVRATNPKGRTVEVSILCSNQRLSIKRVVMLIFNRWVQENDFKYGDRHFGWMQITSYAVDRYEKIADQLRDRQVERPEYRALKRRVSDAERELGKQLLKRKRTAERLADKQEQRDRIEQCIAHETTPAPSSADKHSPSSAASTKQSAKHEERLREYRRQLRSLKQSSAQLKRSLTKRDARIETQSTSLKTLGNELDAAIRKGSRIELLIEQRYCRLDMRRKAMMDALRVTASNMFRQALRTFRPIWGNHRNDHVMLRMLTRCDGLVGSSDGVIEISLWLKGRYQQHQKRAFRTFLDTMTNATNIQFAGRATPVRLKLLDSAGNLLTPLPRLGVPFVMDSCLQR